MDTVNKLLSGSIDLHAHAYPEHTLSMPPRLPNLEWAKMAARYHMRGIVMKSHIYPTSMQVYDLMQNEELRSSGIELFGSITLNYTMGGLNPLNVALAGELGTKVVFMPTWSSKNDVAHNGPTAQKLASIWPGLTEYIRINGGGITVLDENNRVKAEVLEILDIAKAYDMYVSSAHISIQESIVLAEVAAERGCRFVLTHPFNTTIGASIQQQKYVADTGAYVEQCMITCMPMHMRANIHEIARAIEAIGVERTVFSTDAIGAWNPPEPELMRMSIASLLRLGFTEEEVRIMTTTNPEKLLNLPHETPFENPSDFLQF